jgi:hypothetical protein
MATINNLIDLEYTNNPFDLYDKTIWDIKNNEKKQLIEHIDNIISTKFEKKITEQNNIIKELIEENKKMNETLNNLLFDLARHNVFNPAQCYGLEKYHSNILSANQLIEIEYIDYDFVSAELDKFYSTITNYRTSNHVDKDISNKKNFVKKMYLNPNEVSNINFKDKIFRVSAPHFIPYYFQNFIKEMNVRREYFQHDSGNGFKLFIWISDNNDEKSIIDRYPNIKFNFIPNINFQKHSVV